MLYAFWKALVEANGWTLAQVRCDERPTAELLECMSQVGFRRWEEFVARYTREVEADLDAVFIPTDMVPPDGPVDPEDAYAPCGF